MINITIPSAIVVDILKPKGVEGPIKLRATLAQAPENHIFHDYDPKLSITGNCNQALLKLLRKLEHSSMNGVWAAGKVGATVVYVNTDNGPGVQFND